MRVLLAVLLALGASATTAAADSRSKVRGAFGVDGVVYEQDYDGHVERWGVGGGYASITSGDARGADFEVRFATRFIASILEVGPRIYLADDTLYLYGRVGLGFILVVPTDTIVSAGVGLTLGSHFEIEAGAFVANGGGIEEVTGGPALRGSVGIRF